MAIDSGNHLFQRVTGYLVEKQSERPVKCNNLVQHIFLSKKVPHLSMFFYQYWLSGICFPVKLLKHL